MSKDSKKVVLKLIEAHQQLDIFKAREALSPDLVWHVGRASMPLGRADYLSGMEQGALAFSGLSVEIEEMLAEDDRVAALLRVRGRHTGAFQDIPPTGRPIDFWSMWIFRVENQRVVEAWHLDEDFVSRLREASRPLKARSA